MAQPGRTLFRRYMQIVSKWPIDVNKEGRDLSVNIRGRVGKLFPQGELTNLQESEVLFLQREIESLERIINNTHKDNFDKASNYHCSASGLNIEQLRRGTSTEFINIMSEISRLSFIDRMKLKFRLY